MNYYTNPFDLREISTNSPLKILIDTDKMTIGEIETLIDVANLNFINAVFMPTENITKKNLLSCRNLILLTQTSDDFGYTFSAKIHSKKLSFRVRCFSHLTRKYYKPNILDQLNRILEIHFCITKETYIQNNSHFTSPYTNFKDFMTKLGILFASHNYYYSHTNSITNKGFFEDYRFHREFPEYSSLWSSIANSHDGYSSELQDLLNSFRNRATFLLNSYNKVQYICYKTSNNDTVRDSLFYLGYFCLLLTGILDDLSHYIAKIYNIKNAKRKIGLRNISIYKEFLKQLETSNTELYNFITSENIQKYLEIIYPLRNTYSHNHFTNAAHPTIQLELQNNKILETNLVSVTKESHNNFNKANSLFPDIQWESIKNDDKLYYYEIIDFSSNFLSFFLYFINRFFYLIREEQNITDLSNINPEEHWLGNNSFTMYNFNRFIHLDYRYKTSNPPKIP
ncbi:hypothetical protein C6A33_06415 [Streptococcus anginosus]|uniref:hypothetical protein n=1 Tax=Streptococcus anginosus TaxID=1328 RepID=UPI000D02F258|nr:hypothetical protein [Streptococcus anginosus]PRT63017.1 hypothetical protein C6A33_06415 [Streptococcus anginosus]